MGIGRRRRRPTALQEVLEPALHRGPADPFPSAQAAAIDSVVVRHKYAAAERLGGPLARQDAGEPLPERAPAIVSDSIGPVASFTFNPNGTMASKADGNDLTVTPGAASSYTYDSYGNLTSQTDPLGRQTSYTYDTLGRLLTTTPPIPPGATAQSVTTTNSYDALGHLQTVAAPLGRNSSYTYDASGNKLTETDPEHRTTGYQYNALNRLTQVTYPTSAATQETTTYDFRGNAIDFTDPAGHVTHHVYDLAGRLTSVTTAFGTPDAATASYTYYNDSRKRPRPIRWAIPPPTPTTRRAV